MPNMLRRFDWFIVLHSFLLCVAHWGMQLWMIGWILIFRGLRPISAFASLWWDWANAFINFAISIMAGRRCMSSRVPAIVSLASSWGFVPTVSMRWMICIICRVWWSFANLWTVVAKHCVGFSRSCLSVHENCTGNAWQGAHYNILAGSSVDISIFHAIAVTFICITVRYKH